MKNHPCFGTDSTQEIESSMDSPVVSGMFPLCIILILVQVLAGRSCHLKLSISLLDFFTDGLAPVPMRHCMEVHSASCLFLFFLLLLCLGLSLSFSSGELEF